MSPEDQALTDLAADIVRLFGRPSVAMTYKQPTRKEATTAVAFVESRHRVKNQRIPRDHFENMSDDHEPDHVTLAARRHILANSRLGIEPKDAPQLSEAQLLARYGDNSSTPFGRIRQTLNTTFEGEALAATVNAFDEYLAQPALHARHDNSLAGHLTSALYDLDGGLRLPKSVRDAVEVEQDAITTSWRI